jgi:peptidoglycan/LPS O-acetylase OafA/YrhL
MLNKKENYLPGLHGLRFIGAAIVFIGHLDQMRRGIGLYPQEWLPIPDKLGVILFFVLSGHLITFLLFKEKSKSHISLGSFYVRRLLRILPLYYLIVFSALFYNKVDNFTYSDILFHLMVLPNYSGIGIPFAKHVWSIGIEEQFYLIQPIVSKYLTLKSLIVFLLFVVFSEEYFNILDALSHLIFNSFPLPFSIWGPFREGCQYYGCIAIGCLSFIFYYLKKDSLLKEILFSKIFQLATYATLIIMLFITHSIPGKRGVDFRFYAVVFSIIILNVSRNKNSIIKIENSFYRFFGDLSYGIYMFHPSCMYLVFHSLNNVFPKEDGFVINICRYLITFTLTTLLSWLSFKYFERPFLDIKDKFKKT